MTEKQNIHKSAGLLIRDRKLLVARSKGKDMFIPLVASQKMVKQSNKH